MEFLLRGRWLRVFEPLAEVADQDRLVELLGLSGLVLCRLQVRQELLAGRVGFLLVSLAGLDQHLVVVLHSLLGVRAFQILRELVISPSGE